MKTIIAFLAFLLLAISSAVYGQEARTIAVDMVVPWDGSLGGAQFPIPDGVAEGEWDADFWLLEGPQVGDASGRIRVRFNARSESIAGRIASDPRYTVERVVVSE